MLQRIVLLLVALAALGGGAWWYLTAPIPATVTAPPSTANAANGRTIFYIGGCGSCHATPGQDDKTRLGGGLALKSPFGTFYAPNISPDRTDGIGGWTEQQFVTAVKRGISPGGAHYFPAFPYTSYAHATAQDTRDLFAFIRTLPPVSGRVRDHDLPFPFNIRRNVGAWKRLFFEDTLFVPDQSRSPSWNRGAYLVNGFGHCAECHTPRNILGGLKSGQRFAGGPNPDGEGWVPNITQKGLADWSASDIAFFLETGQKPDGDTAGGSMGPVIRNTSQLSKEDRTAMAEYLKSLPPVEGPPRPKKTKTD